jgi:hypothetical protein
MGIHTDTRRRAAKSAKKNQVPARQIEPGRILTLEELSKPRHRRKRTQRTQRIPASLRSLRSFVASFETASLFSKLGISLFH